MHESTEGIILRTRPLTESSLIVQWLTLGAGRMSTVAKGARRAKSPFAGKLDLFYLARLMYSRSNRSELHSLRDVAVENYHTALRHNLLALQQAAYCAALIELTTEIETPIPSVFELMRTLLASFENGAQPVTVIAFEIKLMNEFGLDPALERKETFLNRELIDSLGSLGWNELRLLQISDVALAQITDFMERFLVFEFGRLPKGRAAALQAG